MAGAAVAVALAVSGGYPVAVAQTPGPFPTPPDPAPPPPLPVRGLVADGVVQSSVAAGHHVYVGGDFDYIGPATGPGQILDGGTGARTGTSRFDGPVLAAVEDGAGGWFVGGEFSRVGGVRRASLAHILANGFVDLDWAPQVAGTVLALARWEQTLYVGGNFSSVGGRSRNRLAAVDAVTGEVVPGFDPDVAFDGVPLAPATIVGNPPPALPPVPDSLREAARGGYGYGATESCFDPNFGLRARNELRGVEALAADGQRVYVGGSFTSIGGFERRHLAALDASTGEVDETFDPDAATPGRNPRALSPRAETNGPVTALILIGDRLYAGGDFTSAVGRSRSRLAAFALSDGALVPGFDAAVDGRVRALATAAERLYVGGSFRSIGGARRPNLAALDPMTGAVDSAFDARVGGAVDSLAATGDRLYVGGRFNRIAGAERPKLAAVSPRSGALEREFEANADARVAALAGAEGHVFAGGFFASVGGLVRHGVARLDTRLTPSRLRGQPERGFASAVPISVRTLALDRRRLYVSGFPDSSRRGRIVALDRDDGGRIDGFHPPRGAPDRLQPAGGRLYVGGSGRALRAASGPVAALDRRTGRYVPGFEPRLLGSVAALAPAARGVYVGGALFSAREFLRARRKERVPRSLGLVRLRPDGSRARAFRPLDPRKPAVVRALLRRGDRLFATGLFRTRTRPIRRDLATFDVRNGKPIASFDPPPLQGSALALTGDSLFVNAARASRRRISLVNAADGRPSRTFAVLTGSACTLAATPEALVLGGGFRSLNGQPSENLGIKPLVEGRPAAEGARERRRHGPASS